MASTIVIMILLLTTYAAVRVVYCETVTSMERSGHSSLIAFSSTPKAQSKTTFEQSKSEPLQHNNPHWDKTQCNACHDAGFKKGSSMLHATEKDGLCMDCHKNDTAHKYIHPVGLMLSNDRITSLKSQWKGDLRLEDTGKMTCQTCHDLLDQCLPERTYQAKLNPSFIRGGPYPNRYDLCYRCHDASKYERKNPHDQIADNGMLKMKSCRLCHTVNVNEKIQSGVAKDLEQFPLLQDMNEDRTLLCIRCHQKIDHPSNAFRVRSDKKYRHLVKIDGEIKKTLEDQNTISGVVLPIEPITGRIYCGTCHQPHQPGVFTGEVRSSVTMDNHRLRDKPICKHCHDIYGAISDTGK